LKVLFVIVRRSLFVVVRRSSSSSSSSFDVIVVVVVVAIVERRWSRFCHCHRLSMAFARSFALSVSFDSLEAFRNLVFKAPTWSCSIGPPSRTGVECRQKHYASVQRADRSIEKPMFKRVLNFC